MIQSLIKFSLVLDCAVTIVSSGSYPNVLMVCMMALQLKNFQLQDIQKSSVDEFGVPEIFKRRLGNWSGIYRKVNIEGQLLKKFQGTFSSKIQGADFFQVNDYLYEDGTTKHLEFGGRFDSGVLVLDLSTYDMFEAIAWDGGGCILFDCVKQQHGEPKVRYFETIVYTGDNSRVRTTQEFLDDQFVGVNFIQETTRG